MTRHPFPTRRDLLRQTATGAALVAGAGLFAGACSGPGAPAERATPQPTPAPAPSAPEKARGPLKILILGGTGFVGPAVVEAAQPRGHTLTLFNRGKTNPGLFPDVEKLHGDRDGKLDALAGRKWDAVIDTSGYVPRIVKMSGDLLARSAEHYVFVSTISVYAGFATPGADEDAPLATIDDPTNEEVPKNYGALKALSEKAIEAAMPGRTTIVRPGLIVGPRDKTGRFTYWPTRVERGGEVLAPGNPTDPVQFIDVRDLAGWMIRVLEDRVFGIYNALGPASRLEIGSMLAQMKQAIPKSDARFTWVPADFLEKEKVEPWSHMPVWIPPTGEFAGAGTMSNARAVARGLTFRPVADTTTATLEWIHSLDEAQRIEVTRGAGLPAEREVEVLASWHKKQRKARRP
jgi:2'-hydroxyisoflavone reductase